MPESSPGFPGWWSQVRTEVTAASQRGDVCFDWIRKVEAPDSTFEEFGDSGLMFQSIDAKIMAALTRLLKGELNRRVQQEINTAAKAGKQLKGRQALWIIYRYYATKDTVGVVYGIPDLMEVKWAGDKKSESFLNTWRNVVEGMRIELDERVLEELLLVQIAKSEELKPDVDYYKRLPPKHEDRSYAFLRRALERCVEARLKDKNRENDLRVLRGQVGAPGVGSADEGGGGGRGRGGGKGRGQGKHETLCRFFVKGGLQEGDGL